VNWYVGKNIEQLKTEDEANNMAAIVSSVIQRLTTRDGILIVVEDDPLDRMQRLLSVHANYSLD
jgi:hypothetical protein